jgi:PAS domain S-box-containing protein
MTAARHQSESRAGSVALEQKLGINESWPRYALSIVLLAAVYFVAAKFGLSLASVHTNVSPVWPPTGIAIAAVLLLGYRAWPGIFLGAFLGNFLTPIPAAVAGAIAIGNTLEAVCAAGALNAIGFRISLDRARDIFKFGLVAVLCTMLSATIGDLSLCLGHSARWADFPSLWLTWWLGDLTGALTVAPLILTWCAGAGHWLPKRRYFEATVLILLLSLSAMVTFGGVSPAPVFYYPLTRLMIPFLLWASFRLGRRGVTVAIAVISAFAIWGTWQGLGPFISGAPNNSLLMLQLFIASNAVTFLFLVTVVEERWLAEKTGLQIRRRLEANLAVTRILAESPEPSVALQRILSTIGETLSWEFGGVWVPTADGKRLRSIAIWQARATAPHFEELCRELTFESGIGLPGRVWANLKPVWIPDVAKDDNFPRARAAMREDLHAAFAFPIPSNEKLLGVIEFFSSEIRQPDEALLAMFAGIGGQIGQFMERKRAEAAVESASLLPKENPLPVIRLTREGIISYLNPAAQPLLDIWQVTLGQQAPEEIVDAAGQAFEADERQPIEISVAERTYAVLLVPIISADYVNMYFNDITDLKRVEHSLRESEARYRFVIEALPAAVYTTDAEGRLTMFNQAAVELSGRVPEIGTDSWCVTWKLYHPDGRPMPHDEYPMAMALKEGKPNRGQEAIAERPDGSRINFIPYPTPLRDSAGQITGAINMLVDITDRKRTEETLRHFAAIVEATDDAVISKDLNGIITSWNPAAESLYGYKAEEAIGKSVTMLIPPERPDEEPAILQRLRSGERIDRYETIRIAKDGRRINVSLTVSPIRNAHGTIIGASKIARDITQQKKTQDEITRLFAAERAARQDAEVASRTKDEFLAVLSHELRTPLTAMLGWLSILRGHQLDQKTTEHAIETIERNAKAQAQLIEDLVDISRIVGGKLNLEVSPIDLQPVINAAVEVVRPAADAKNITIHVNYDPHVGPVSGDPSRLQQIVWNLLSNAVKFTPKDGSVHVDFRRYESHAELVVRDTGIGIAPDFLPHVFERFRQAESTATRSHRGMGLGLAIVRHLIELHGGTVWAASDGENQGASFTVQLPLAAVKERPATGAVAATGNGEDKDALHGLRILLVEDEPDARELIAMLLQSSGANVEAVDSAGDALQRLPLFIPDLLLSDIGLPRESGYDLIRKVRALSSELNRVPAIALTAFATESDRKMSLTAGFQAHLAKPVEPTNLVSTIKNLLNGKS